MFLTLIAQEAAGSKVDGTVTTLERILEGGVPLICLCIAVVCGVAFYWQLKRNNKLAEDALNKAEKREEAAKNAAAERMAEQEALLREMLERDREAQEAQSAATAAVEGFTRALQDHNRIQNEMLDRLKDIERAVRA